LQDSRQSVHNARPAPSSSTHSSVILNAVKDLRLPLRVSKWRYFRIADNRKMIADLVGLSHPVNAALAVSFHR